MPIATRMIGLDDKAAGAQRGWLAMMIAGCTALALLLFCDAASAQAIKQIQLTEKQVTGFIAAQKDMAAITDKMQGSASDKPDPKIQAEVEAVAKKNGFANFGEYDDVAANIAMIMSGLDPGTKQFLEPELAIKKEIEEVTADKTIPDKEKKQMLDELNEALKTAQPVKFASNIELVKKFFDQLEAALQ